MIAEPQKTVVGKIKSKAKNTDFCMEKVLGNLDSKLNENIKKEVEKINPKKNINWRIRFNDPNSGKMNYRRKTVMGFKNRYNLECSNLFTYLFLWLRRQAMIKKNKIIIEISNKDCSYKRKPTSDNEVKNNESDNSQSKGKEKKLKRDCHIKPIFKLKKELITPPTFDPSGSKGETSTNNTTEPTNKNGGGEVNDTLLCYKHFKKIPILK